MTPLARASDPATSHAAAVKAQTFLGTHEDRIVAALTSPANCYDLARRTGLSHVQVDRRMKALLTSGRVRLTGRNTIGDGGSACAEYDREFRLE